MFSKLTIVVLGFIFVIGGLMFTRAFAGTQNVPAISVDELQAKMLDPKAFFLLDVREPSEFESNHISGATLIPLGALRTRLNEIPKDKTIIVYCRSGARSARGAALLKDNGYTNVLNLTGGILAWQNKCQSDKSYC